MPPRSGSLLASRATITPNGVALRRLTLLAAAVVTLLPVTLLSTAGSASAASGTLTVNTYDRSGQVFHTSLRIINLSSNQSYTASSFSAKALPKGAYAVITDMWNQRDGTDTLGATMVTVPAGAVTATIDARGGQPVGVRLDQGPGAGYAQTVRAAICSEATGAPIKVDAYNQPGKLFVLSNNSTHLRFSWSSIWQSQGGNETWMVAGGPHPKVPAGVHGTIAVSSLGTVSAAVRRGPAGSDQAGLTFHEDDDCHPGYGVGVFGGPAPGTAKVHASAGKWRLDADWSAVETGGATAGLGFDWRKVTVAAGRTSSTTFFASAWGPAYHVPEMMTGASLNFDTSTMFRDPGNADEFEASERSLVTLTDSRSRVVKQQWRQNWADGDPGFIAKVPAKGWYTLQVNARRYRPGITYPADLLSSSSQAIFRVSLDPEARPYLTDVQLPRLAPAGLNLNNQGTAGGTTVVQILPDRRSGNPDITVGRASAIRTVTLLASFDEGRTWTSMPVTGSGTTWQGTVTNAMSGRVWLRSRVTSVNGAYGEVTIARAYALG
ncbi:hypothetical protein ACWT_6258 [Actinoplanes sp. SE50]|nr:hypothetical protein ACPL_6391 [Actinoplanes sp. SE50/110]ATO85673.1 hypothetical protein ACWT_6258 [Actinoplanes sp. SE50]SLM03086.1 hypothetical protein ACSP50_6375 [Actinoplanes sp. SE50/110]